jgi:hypothetical protein
MLAIQHLRQLAQPFRSAFLTQPFPPKTVDFLGQLPRDTHALTVSSQ